MKAFQFLLSALVLIGAIYGWGKFRTYIAKEHMKKGLESLESSNPLEAIREFQEATTDLGNDPEIWYYLAKAFCQAGDRDDALNALVKALQANSEFQPALDLKKHIEDRS